ncbi:MAG: Arm DNA-binding domain-containing protein [Jannaschia sp.]
MGNLTALSIKSAPPGKHEDGDGLRLIKREDGGGQWVFRYTLYGRRREMGLGGLKALSLRDARDLASEYRTSVAKGKDPIENRRRQRQDAMDSRHLLKDVALDAFDSRKADLKGGRGCGTLV